MTNLKALAHHLKPVVLIGKNGVTESVSGEISANLDAHELIKIKFLKKIPEDLNWIGELGAQLIDQKGHILTIYRKNPKKKS